MLAQDALPRDDSAVIFCKSTAAVSDFDQLQIPTRKLGDSHSFDHAGQAPLRVIERYQCGVEWHTISMNDD